MGLRQGGILSPFLFNYYINSVLTEVSESRVGCSLNLTMTNILCYADDIALLAPSAKGLQILIELNSTKLEKLCLAINPGKSKYIVFKSSKRTNIQ